MQLKLQSRKLKFISQLLTKTLTSKRKALSTNFGMIDNFCLRTQSMALKHFTFKANRNKVRESDTPIEALYNVYVNKVKDKELKHRMRPREVVFRPVDSRQVKSFERNLPSFVSKEEVGMPKLETKIRSGLKKRVLDKINVTLHNDHVNYQKGLYSFVSIRIYRGG